MGRSASHIALECYLQTRANYVIIGEEIKEKNLTLKDISDEMVDIIVKRSKLGKTYGTFLIPEGAIEFFNDIGILISEINDIVAHNEKPSKEKIIEFLTEKSRKEYLMLPLTIQDQFLLDRDPHGNVNVS